MNNNYLPYSFGNFRGNYQNASGIRSCPSGNSAKASGDLVLAMGYVPSQQFGGLYAPSNALCQGTAFEALDLPFCGRRGR